MPVFWEVKYRKHWRKLRLIKSRMILGAAVKNLDMEIIAKPKYFPVIGEAIARRFQKHNEGDEVSSPLFGQTQYAWGGESIRVDTFTVPPNLLEQALYFNCRQTRPFSVIA